MKKRHLGALAFLAAGVFLTHVRADDVTSETTAGAGSQSEDLSFESKDSGAWSWTVGYGYSHLAEDDPVAGRISDSTNEATGGFDWENRLLLGAGFAFSSTPAEHLTTAGPNFEAGYTWKFGELVKPQPEIRHKEAKQPDVEKATSSRGANPLKEEGPEQEDFEPFHPSIGIRSNVALLSFKQSFTGTVPSRPGRPARPTNLNEQILQTGWTWELTIDPVEWMGIKGTFTNYFYNRNVVQFMQQLDTSRAVSLGVGGFADTLNGFQTNQESIDFTFYLSEQWESDFIANLAKSAVDGSDTHGYEVMVAKQWGAHWKTGVGYEYDNSPQLVQSLGIANITYYF